jgi:gliding motility-associated-like protein
MLGQSAPIYAQGTAPFTWSPIEGLSCSTCANPTATPSTTTTYCVETTENNCINSACVTIFIDETCGEVFVPNAFSPNGDGNNDCLKVYSNCLEKVLFRIYSRWGAMIYETEDIEACWNGEYNGSTLNSGVYVYTVKAKLINGEEIDLKGDVTLFK